MKRRKKWIILLAVCATCIAAYIYWLESNRSETLIERVIDMQDPTLAYNWTLKQTDATAVEAGRNALIYMAKTAGFDDTQSDAAANYVREIDSRVARGEWPGLHGDKADTRPMQEIVDEIAYPYAAVAFDVTNTKPEKQMALYESIRPDPDDAAHMKAWQYYYEQIQEEIVSPMGRPG